MQQSITQARPYARAAFDYAREHDGVVAWENILSDLALLASDRQVAAYLANPKVLPQQALALLNDIFADKLTLHMQNFLRLLAEARQLYLLPSIAQLFTQYEADYSRSETVEVIAAKPLSEAQQEKLNIALTERLQKKVQLNYKVAPTLLGGAIIRTHKWVIDGSVKGRLEQLKTTLVG